MNERIKELMEQSMPVIDWNARHGVELNNGERLKHMSDWFDNFAQLILKDVDVVVDDLFRQMPLEQAAVLMTLDENLKDHFYGGK